MEPAGSIVNSKLEIEDIAWLYESGHAIHTCLSRHLWLQQDGPKQPLDVPYNSSKVMTDLGCCQSQSLSCPHGPHLTWCEAMQGATATGKMATCRHDHAAHRCHMKSMAVKCLLL